MNEKEEPLKIQKILRFLLYLFGAVIFFTIAAAWWRYPETYEFFKEAVSNLGGIQSETGFDNSISSLIMTIGFGIGGLVALAISIIYFVKKDLQFNIGKGILSLAIAAGAACVGMPLDHPQLHQVHYVGAAIFLLAFASFNFLSQLGRYYRKHGFFPEEKSFDFWLDFIIAWIALGAVVLFLIIFLLDHYLSTTLAISVPLAQKIVLIINFIAILIFNTNDM
ncbi:MAG: hypothetical protein ACTSX6_10645 [Candidatus Heimdallarchaeaceae archaeon]